MEKIIEFEKNLSKLILNKNDCSIFPNLIDDIDTLVFGGNGIKAYAYAIVLQLFCSYWWLLKYGHLIKQEKVCKEKTKRYVKRNKILLNDNNNNNNNNGNILFENEEYPSFIRVSEKSFLYKLINEFCKKRIKVFAGTSSGSLFSFMLSCNVPFKFIKKTTENGRELLENVFNSFGKNNIILNSSLSDIDVFKKHIEKCFKKNNINLDITFEQHYRKYKKIFICNTVCLETEKHLIMNYKTTPKMRIIDALLASCSLPGIFQPINIDGYSYVDGGIALNNLLPLFDPKKSFGFMMGRPEDKDIDEYYNQVGGLKRNFSGNFNFGLKPLNINKDNVYIESNSKTNKNFIQSIGSKVGSFINFLLNYITQCTWEMFNYDHLKRVIFIKTVYDPTRKTLMDDLERDVRLAFYNWQNRTRRPYVTLFLSLLLLFYDMKKRKQKLI